MTYKYTKEQIKDTVEGLGYKYFEGDNYDVNIVGIRNSKTEGKITNKFDDLMTISYKDENVSGNIMNTIVRQIQEMIGQITLG